MIIVVKVKRPGRGVREEKTTQVGVGREDKKTESHRTYVTQEQWSRGRGEGDQLRTEGSERLVE